MWGAVTGLAVAIGPLLGGVLTSGLSWRWIFFVNAPIGVIAVVISVLRVSESRAPTASRPDWAGFVLFTAALSLLVYGLIESNQRSFTDSLVLGCLVAAAVLLVAFILVERRIAHPMFDLSLFRLPTFTGGSVAAFGLSASIFAMLLYIVLYVQDILGYSPLGTGVRVMFLSGAILVSATVAGRLTSKVPIRWLIGPGLLLVGVGLLLMRGLNAGSSWTHLIPGMIVGGLGVGLVNPPLASTAVGVVRPQQAGMASGINSTFRQVGIATGIALLGTLFSNKVADEVRARIAAVPPLSHQGPKIASAVQSGEIGQVIAKLPPQLRGTVATITRAAFTTGLNRILLVAAIIALVSAVVSLVAIRTKDFRPPRPRPAWPRPRSGRVPRRRGPGRGMGRPPSVRPALPAGVPSARRPAPGCRTGARASPPGPRSGRRAGTRRAPSRPGPGRARAAGRPPCWRRRFPPGTAPPPRPPRIRQWSRGPGCGPR